MKKIDVLVAFTLLTSLSPIARSEDTPSFVIPPLVECLVQDAKGKEWTAGGPIVGENAGPTATCGSIGNAASDRCGDMLTVGNAALAKCQTEKHAGVCQTVKCWENPQ